MFSCQLCETFKNTLFYRASLVRLLLKIWEMSLFNKFSLQLKSCLRRIHFHSYSFATSMIKMSSDIFFSIISLKNTSCRKNAKWKNSLEIMKNQGVPLWCYVTLLKRDPSTGDFLWILRNSQEDLFYRKPPYDCYWKQPIKNFSILRKVFAKWIVFNQTQDIF